MIKRKLLGSIRKHLGKKEITVIIGPRQSGKTTLMRMLKNEVEAKGGKTVFLNLDLESDKVYFDSQQELINKLRLELGRSRGYVFIDEIQRKENAGLFLKGIYDMQLPYKFIVSGSGSLELKSNIKESLTGRKRLFELLPVTFEEFVNYRTDYRYESNLLEFAEVERPQLEFLLKEYLVFGGYPRVVTEELEEEKRYLLEEIFRSYVERDLVYLLRINRPDVFTQMVRLLAAQIGRILTFSGLAEVLGLNLVTLKKYLWMAQQTFVIYLVSPFYRNRSKELTKSPVPYFYDMGLRNFALRRLSLDVELSELSFVFQNFVFNEMKQKVIERGWELHYWRTKDKAEVDMVIDTFRKLIPVEIKFSHVRDLKITRSLRSFIEKYHPPEAWVVNLSRQDEIVHGRTRVKFLPYYRVVLADLEF